MKLRETRLFCPHKQRETISHKLTCVVCGHQLFPTGKSEIRKFFGGNKARYIDKPLWNFRVDFLMRFPRFRKKINDYDTAHHHIFWYYDSEYVYCKGCGFITKAKKWEKLYAIWDKWWWV